MSVRRGGWVLVEFSLAWILILAATLLGGTANWAQAQTISTTTVTDTIYRGDGTPASGTVLISWGAFTTAGGSSVPAGTTSVTLANGGVLSVALVPNAGSTPMGTYYTAVYHLSDGTQTREYWVVPAVVAGSTAPVTLAGIRSTVLPASVAMQTVSKSYVDTAIAAAVTGHPLDSTPYVLKAGDAMTGPLALPGDPTAATQAADKHYVDTQIASVAGGTGQKVSLQPAGTQVVAQPAGTQLEVNILNGAEYASQYASGTGAGAGNNGIANAAASPDCAKGCGIVAEQTYAGTELVRPTTWNNETELDDRRGGGHLESFLNPLNLLQAGQNAGAAIDVQSTQSAADVHAKTGAGNIFSLGLSLTQEGLAGGSNGYPKLIQGAVPYFKTTYSALAVNGTYNTPGQHVLMNEQQNCFAVGDCLMGGMFMLSSGGFRDDADEGAHPFDLNFAEDGRVFTGTCGLGCTSGSTTVQITPIGGAGTQGEGRYLMDTTPAKVITTGTLIGPVLPTGRQAGAVFTGTNFPLSVFLETAQTIPTQANNIVPGTVTIPIVTSGVPAGFATSTAALPTGSGVACVADAANLDGRPLNFETAAYMATDGTHMQLTLKRAHASGATIAVGGLCGYGLEQTVDTSIGIRQVFPVIGSTSATTLLYAENNPVVGYPGYTSAFANINLPVASVARSGNVVTVTTAGNLPADVNGLTMTVAGVADASYNGSFQVTSTGPSSLQFTQTGANSTSTGGTVSLVTGGFALYPMAEVVSVFNAGTKAVDGQMTLAANTVPWAAGDSVEQPHYFQENVHPDVALFTQTEPRLGNTTAGITYAGNNGPGMIGWSIANAVPASQYFGNGGTHYAPSWGMNVSGLWQVGLQMQAGEQAAIALTCNSHGCNKWNSAYDLFQMQTSVGTDRMTFNPQTSTLNIGLRGAGYLFTPTGLTANTINVTTLNAGTITGAFSGTGAFAGTFNGAVTGSVAASSLPVFGPSGAGHSVGAVPDPGAVAGTTRFLREDGNWAAAGGGTGPQNMPQRANLVAEHLLNEGSGTVIHDTSPAAANASLSFAAPASAGPAWEGTQDLTFSGPTQSLVLSAAANSLQSLVVVVYSPPFGVGQTPQAPGFSDNSTFGPQSLLVHSNFQSGALYMTSGSTDGISSRFRFQDNTEAGEAMSAGWHVFGLRCGAGGVQASEFFDGAEVGSYFNRGNNTCPVQSSGNYQIGGVSGLWFRGKVAAVWAWSTPLTNSDMEQAYKSAWDYVHAKGLVTDFRKVAQGRQYVTNLTPTVQTGLPLVIGGFDSRTAGVGLASYTGPAQGWPDVLEQQGNPTGTSGGQWINQMVLDNAQYQRVNWGSAGMRAFDLCPMFDTTIGSWINDNDGVPTVLMLWGGVNDILFGNGHTMRQTANDLRCEVKKAKAAGARVIVATEIDSSVGGTGTTSTLGDSGKDALDAIIRAEATSVWGADSIADLATDPVLGADGASANSTIFSDGIHPTPTGETHVTAIMQNALNELLGSNEASHNTSAAAAYQELARDRYLDLTGTAAQTVTLPSCTGYTLPRFISNVGTAAAAVNAASGQTLVGATSVPVGARAIYTPIPGALATSGCSWRRIQ